MYMEHVVLGTRQKVIDKNYKQYIGAIVLREM